MIENIIKCPECGLSFEGFEGYTCPHCGKPAPLKMKMGGHMHTGLKCGMYMHDPETKHGCVIIAAWSKKYIDIIGGKEVDSYIVLKLDETKIIEYKDDWGNLFSGSPESNPQFAKWDSEYIEYLREGR